MKIIALLLACVLGGCTSSHMVQTRLPDGKIVAHVYASGQDLTAAAATISTYECKPKCVHVATGGGVTNGAAGIIGPAAGGLAYGIPAAIAGRSAGTAGNSVTTNVTAGATSNARSTGAGSSQVNVVNTNRNRNIAVGTGGSASSANQNTNF